MAWQQRQVYEGEGQTSTVWYNTETGETSYQDPASMPAASGQISLQNLYQGEGQSSSQYFDTGTGKAASDQGAAETQYTKQLDDAFQKVWQDPNASSWDKAMAVQERYGVETLAQLAGQGGFADISAQLGPHIAARQAEGEAEGFSIGGNQLGLLPVALAMGGAGLYGSLYGGSTTAAAAPTAAGAGSTSATQLTAVGGAGATGAGVGGISTAGFDAANLGAGGATTSSPGLSAGGFEATNLGAGGVSASPGIAVPAGGAGGALSTGSFAAEGLAPVLAESSALGGAGAAGALGTGAAGASALSASGGASSFGGDGGGGASGGGSATGGGGLGGGSWLTSDDEWLKMLMRGAPGLLGALGSASQAEDFEDLANQYSNMGAPYRSRLQELYGNPQAFLNSPEVRVPIQQGTDMLARSLSVKGNPAGSGNALQELQNYTSNQLFSRLGQEKDRLGGFGGLTQYNQAAPQMAQSALAAQGNIYGDLGGAAADIFNPPKRYTLQDLMRSMG